MMIFDVLRIKMRLYHNNLPEDGNADVDRRWYILYINIKYNYT